MGLGQVIAKVNPKHLILVHGSLDALHELARSGDLQDKHFVHIPKVGERIEFGVAPQNLNQYQKARIDTPPEFEVEIVAEAQGARIRIPQSVVQSPGWQTLAANGYLKAKWNGVGLKLYCASDRDLMIEKIKKSATASEQSCCNKCQFLDKDIGYCQCENSPLAERIVDPTGYCLEFASCH